MKSKKSRELPRHHRQKTAKKHKNKTKRCDRSSKQLFIHTTNKTRKNKQTNKTHLQQYYTLKTIERRLCLLGFVLIFCLCISEKFNQVSFKCHPWRSSPPLKNKKQKKKLRQIVWRMKKKSRKRKLFHWFHHLSSYAFLWKEKKNFSSPYIYLKRNKWRNFLQNYEKE